MVAVGNVEAVETGERINHRLIHGHRHAPQLVAHFVWRDEVVERIGLGGLGDDRIDFSRGAIGQEDRTGLRANGQHVTRAIVFFVGPGLLVLLDQVAIVFIDREARCHARLHVRPHVEAVDVEAGFVFNDQRRLVLQPREVLRGQVVDRVAVGVRARGQLDFGPRHAEKAQRVALGQRAGLFGIDDVVGHRRHGGRRLGRRPQSPEGVDGRHAD